MIFDLALSTIFFLIGIVIGMLLRLYEDVVRLRSSNTKSRKENPWLP